MIAGVDVVAIGTTISEADPGRVSTRTGHVLQALGTAIKATESPSAVHTGIAMSPGTVTRQREALVVGVLPPGRRRLELRHPDRRPGAEVPNAVEI